MAEGTEKATLAALNHRNSALSKPLICWGKRQMFGIAVRHIHPHNPFR
jgi:hypothetical protein